MDFVENVKDPNATSYNIPLKDKDGNTLGAQNVTISNVKGGENCFWLTPSGENTPVICIDPNNMILTFNNKNHIFDAISKDEQISAKLTKVTMESNQNITFTLETSSGAKTTYKIDGNTVYQKDGDKFVPIYRGKGFDIALPQNLMEMINKNQVNAKEFPNQMFDMLEKDYGYKSFISTDKKLRLLKSPDGKVYVARGSKIIPTYGAEYFKDGNKSVLGLYTNNAKGIVNGKSTNGIGFKLTEDELKTVANFIEGKEVTADQFKEPSSKVDQSVNFRGRANIVDTTKQITPAEETITHQDPPPEDEIIHQDPPPEDDDKKDPPPEDEIIHQDPPPEDDDKKDPPPPEDDDKKDPPPEDGDKKDPPPPEDDNKKDPPKQDPPKGDNPPTNGGGDKKDDKKEKINLAKPLSAIGYLAFIIMMVAAAFMPLSPVMLFMAMVVFSLATILKTTDLSISSNIHPFKKVKEWFTPKTKEQLLEKAKQNQLTPDQQVERNDLLLKEKQGTLTDKERARLNKLNEKARKDPLTKRERARLNKLLAQDGPAAARAREQRQDAEALTRLQDQTFQADKQNYLDRIQSNIDNRQKLLDLAEQGIIPLTDEQKNTLTKEINDFNQYKTDVSNGVLNISKTHNDTVVRDLQVAEENIVNNNPFSEFDTSDIELTTFDTRLEKYKETHNPPEISDTYATIVDNNRDILNQYEQQQNNNHNNDNEQQR